MTGIVQRLDLEQLWSELKLSLIGITPMIAAYLYFQKTSIFQCQACSGEIAWEILHIMYSFMVGLVFWGVVFTAKNSVELLIDRYTVQEGGDE